jgi:ferredoxin
MPGRLACEREPMPCIHPGECGACEPACPAEAIFSEDDVPGQGAQFSTENARVLRPARPPGGTAKTGPLPHDTATSPATSPAGDGAVTRPTAAQHPAPREQVTSMRYRLEVRLTAADVGKRVVIRWRRPGPDDGDQIADVLGILEEHDGHSFAVRTRDGTLVVIPAGRALAGKVVPPPPVRRRRAGPRPP